MNNNEKRNNKSEETYRYNPCTNYNEGPDTVTNAPQNTSIASFVLRIEDFNEDRRAKADPAEIRALV